MNYNCLKEYGVNLAKALDTVNQSFVDELKGEIVKRIGTENNIYLMGNGGSAANAQHIVGDYSKTFALLGKAINIISLSENSCYVTALSNDLDFSEIFEVLVKTRVRSNDLIIFLSGSGNSMNLVKAARYGLKKKFKMAAILGYKGGALKDLVNIPIHVEVNDMEIAEDVQMAIFHFIKQKIYCKFSEENDSNNKYNKRINEDLIA